MSAATTGQGSVTAARCYVCVCVCVYVCVCVCVCVVCTVLDNEILPVSIFLCVVCVFVFVPPACLLGSREDQSNARRTANVIAAAAVSCLVVDRE